MLDLLVPIIIWRRSIVGISWSWRQSIVWVSVWRGVTWGWVSVIGVSRRGQSVFSVIPAKIIVWRRYPWWNSVTWILSIIIVIRISIIHPSSGWGIWIIVPTIRGSSPPSTSTSTSSTSTKGYY